MRTFKFLSLNNLRGGCREKCLTNKILHLIKTIEQYIDSIKQSDTTTKKHLKRKTETGKDISIGFIEESDKLTDTEIADNFFIDSYNSTNIIYYMPSENDETVTKTVAEINNKLYEIYHILLILITNRLYWDTFIYLLCYLHHNLNQIQIHIHTEKQTDAQIKIIDYMYMSFNNIILFKISTEKKNLLDKQCSNIMINSWQDCILSEEQKYPIKDIMQDIPESVLENLNLCKKDVLENKENIKKFIQFILNRYFDENKNISVNASDNIDRFFISSLIIYSIIDKIVIVKYNTQKKVISTAYNEACYFPHEHIYDIETICNDLIPNVESNTTLNVTPLINLLNLIKKLKFPQNIKFNKNIYKFFDWLQISFVLQEEQYILLQINSVIFKISLNANECQILIYVSTCIYQIKESSQEKVSPVKVHVTKISNINECPYFELNNHTNKLINLALNDPAQTKTEKDCTIEKIASEHDSNETYEYGEGELDLNSGAVDNYLFDCIHTFIIHLKELIDTPTKSSIPDEFIDSIFNISK